ncbi:5-oxoprolinase/urea amidolyase family protein [Gordonia sp. HNM0687]|uniref:5-oxoprolinase/urea amidolyase family protein n=1 Tax=Gordonia mangrovi TaxID=2665643 RepID=A0A6L7GVP0_9ACTN|nr:biotin-dependent carboxyltransferase family protein [Gordonia mangrovi]MXP22705.1 5-oxoprolinase/urea amidolyase family protein [Gordonia mangrovi]UVF77026.1 biotin-dependent carboxyltransferase family protein [Gordonia mangrovi]
MTHHRHLIVVQTGPLATVQDLGRSGYAHLGVPVSGGADRGSLTLANRLVGNPESAAVIETTLGGLHIRLHCDVLIAVTGARAQVHVDGIPVGTDAALPVSHGSEVIIGSPTRGCRNYLAVRGGIGVPPVLGSRSTDVLSELGPTGLRSGMELPVGKPTGDWPAASSAPRATADDDVTELEVTDGPRRDHVQTPGHLIRGVWEVGADSNRVGVRLSRPADCDDPLVVHRSGAGELASEGIPHGAVQIPPSGRPVLFLADHPVTGGYPVVAVLTADAVDRAAQLVAGDRVRFRAR